LVRVAIAPLIRALIARSPTSGSLDVARPRSSPGRLRPRGQERTLTTGIVFRQIEDLRFRRVVKEMIPIDPIRD